ncbi:hypothetical protein [Salmonella enterica]
MHTMDTRISHRPPGPHRIPDILQDAPYRDLPLYMLVAWWVYGSVTSHS